MFLLILLCFQIIGVAITADFPFGSNVRVNDDITEVIRETPEIAVDGTGNIYTVWTDYRNGDPDIYFASSSDRGKTFSPSIRINDDGAGNTQIHPDIAVDGSGNIYITWQDGRNDLYDVYFTNSSDGGITFSPNRVVDSAPFGESQEYPSVAVDDIGTIFIGWADDEGTGDWNIYCSNSTDGGQSFSSGVKVNDDITTADQKTARMTASGNGEVFIVWEDERNEIWRDVYFAKSVDGGNSFLPNVRVDDTLLGISVRDPEIAIDNSQNIYVTWTDNRNSDFDVIFTNSTDGGLSFSPNKKVNDDLPGNFHNNPHIAAFGNGEVKIVWDDNRVGPDFDIYFAKSINWGINFSSNIKVNDDIGNADQFGTDIALDANGYSYIIWTDQRERFIDVYSANDVFAITDIEVRNITDTTATISWLSNRPANSTVEYGFSDSYGSNKKEFLRITNHEINLTSLEAGRLYHFRVVSYNSLENYSVSHDLTFTTKFPIFLEPGWNMISVPLNQTDMNVSQVFESIEGDYDAVQWYDVTNPMDHWKHNHIIKSPMLNDLNEVNRSKGLWIHVTNPLGTTLYVDGIAPEVGYVNQVILNPGWNLVGYPSLIERIPPFSLPIEVNIVQWYNASSGLWESWDPGSISPDNLPLMRPGQGFWVHTTGPTTPWLLEYVN
jgi:hypothetical protein